MNPNAIIRTIANAFLRKGVYGIARKWNPVVAILVGVAVGLALFVLR